MADAKVKKDEAPSTSVPKTWPFPFPASRRNIITLLVVLSILFLGVISICLYLSYRPSKPVFTVAGANIYQLVITSAAPPFTGAAISSAMQFSVLARNPRGRSDIIFNRLVAYVAYQNQPITPPANLPPFELTHGGALSMEVMVGGDKASAVPVPPEVVKGLEMDKVNGAVGLRLVMMGMMKYKTPPYSGGWERTQVRCDVVINLRSSLENGALQAAMAGVTRCSVET